MYNGIGLTTPRGSGTNGHVQRNWAFVRPGKKDNSNYATEEDIKKSEARLNRPPNKDILDHDRKRKIEVKCIEFEEILEKQGRSADEIKKKVDSYREKLLSQTKSDLPKDEFGRISVRETHQLAEAQLEKNIKLREAFNIPQYFVDGSSFDSDKKAKEALLKSAALQKELELQRQSLSAMTSVDEDMKRRYAIVRTPSKERDNNVEQDHRVSSKTEKKKKRKRARESSTGSPERKRDKKKKSKKSKKESKKKASRKRKVSETSLNESDNHSETNSDLDPKKARKKAKKDKRKAENDSKKDEIPADEGRSRKSNKERTSHSSSNNPFRSDSVIKSTSRVGQSKSRKRNHSRSTESPERRRSRSLDSSRRWPEKSRHSSSERYRQTEKQIRRSKSRDLRRTERTDKTHYKDVRRSSEEQRNNMRMRYSRGDGRDASDRGRRISAERRSSERSRQYRNDKNMRDIEERSSPNRPYSRLRSPDRSRENYRRRRYSRSRSRSRSHESYKVRRDLSKDKVNPFKTSNESNQRENSFEKLEKRKRRSNSNSNKKRSSSHSDHESSIRKYRKKSSESNKREIHLKSEDNNIQEHINDEDKSSKRRNSASQSSLFRSSKTENEALEPESVSKASTEAYRRSVSESRTPPYRRQSESASSDQEIKSEASEHSNRSRSSSYIPKENLKTQCTTPPLSSPDSKKDRKSVESDPSTTPPLVKPSCGTPKEYNNANSNSSELSYSPARKNPDRYKDILQNITQEKKKKEQNSPLQNKHTKDGDKKSQSRPPRDQRSKSIHHAPAACLQSNSSESDEDDNRGADKEASALEEFQAPKRNVAIGEMAMLQQLAVKAREKIKSKEQLERQGHISNEGNRNKTDEERSKENKNSFQVSDKVVSQRSVRNSLSEFLAANNARTLSAATTHASNKYQSSIDSLSTQNSVVVAATTTAAAYSQPLESAQPTNIEEDDIPFSPANGQEGSSPTQKSRVTSAAILATKLVSTKKPAAAEREITPERNNNVRDHKTPPLSTRKSSYHRLNYHGNRSSLNINNGGLGISAPSTSSSSKYSLNNLSNKTVSTATRKSVPTGTGAFSSSSNAYHNRMSRVNSSQFVSGTSAHFSNNQIMPNKNYANGNPIIIGRREHQRQYHHYRSSNPHFANNHPLNTADAFCSNNILLTSNNGSNNNNGSNCQANCTGSHYHHNHSNSNNSSTYHHHRSHHKDGHSHSHHHHHHSHTSHHGTGNQLISDPMLVASSLSVVATGRSHHYPYHFSNHGALNASSNSAVAVHSHQSNYAVAAVAAAANSSSLSYHQQQKQKIIIKPFKIHDPQPLATALADSALVDTIVSKVSTATVAAAAAAERERRSHSRPRRSRSSSRNGDHDDHETDEKGSRRSSSHSDYSRSSSSSSRFGSRSNSSKSRSRSASQSSVSSNSSKSSSQSSNSSGSSRSGSRSPSIPRRRGSPSFLDRRRITSARKRPIPYHRKTPSDNTSYCSSCCSRAGSSPLTPPSCSPTRSSHSPAAAF